MSSSLFVGIIDLDLEEKYVTCSLRSSIVLFLCQYVNSPVILVKIKSTVEEFPKIKFLLNNLSYTTILEDNLPKPAADCLLPVYQSNDDPYCTAGFCSSLRMLIKSLGENFQWLLGFRKSCLSACAEVSSWTKFCEVEIQTSIKSFFQKHIDFNSPLTIPIQFARFECHLSQPLQVHNINKRISKNSQNFAVRFADEENPTLSDLLIVPNIHIGYSILGDSVFRKFLPLTWKWYKLILERLNIIEALNNILVEVDIQLPSEYLLPEVPPHSLYKCDLRRYNPHSKLYVKQNVQNILQLYESLNINIKNNYSYNLKKINWSELPTEACPVGGDIPEKRLVRKTQQLENLIQAVLQVAKDGDIIVDFCCGSGHLGIVIAYLRPSLTVILVDNKEESLRRAKDRVENLKLKNIMVVHSNLDYFNADFQVGVCLHGCGVATDLVLEKCMLQNAAFVVCPCCYGSIQDNHILEYPRSQVLRTNLTFEDYLVLCHCADQTHFDPKCTKTLQGYSCMAAVDGDRAIRAIESGYDVTLSKLIPATCTPKNNILVGIPL